MMESYADRRMREIVNTLNLPEVEPMPRKGRSWSGRSLPRLRLDKTVAPATDLYFIETECAERHIKIGIAANAKARLNKLQMCCPYKLNILAVIPGKSHMEKELHQRFVADRLHGEWFRRSDALLAVIDELVAVPRYSNM